MIISTYEGALVPFNQKNGIINRIELYINLKAIRKYILNDGKFLLMTKYKPAYILEMIDKYKIPYNYLSFYNGLVTLDNNGSIVNSFYIDKETVLKIRRVLKDLNLEHIVNYYNEQGLKTDDSSDDVVLIDINTYNKGIFNISKYIRDLNLGYCINSKGISLFKNITKNEIIENIKNKTNTKDVIMLSDYKSDLDLLKKYDGYCISRGSIDRNNIEGIKTVPSVKTLIKKMK